MHCHLWDVVLTDVFNLLNLPHVDSNQIAERSETFYDQWKEDKHEKNIECHVKGGEYFCTCYIMSFNFNLQTSLLSLLGIV